MQTARIAGLMTAAWLVALPTVAQDDARQRQAAAEAYDQGTAAYLSGDYEKAAEWFETANRLSPAAPALIQAARSLQQAGHHARAATLALRLTTQYADDQSAVEFGSGVLDRLAGQLVRVDVACEGCALDVDGTLQEWPSFFVDPGAAHVVTASFETGPQTAEVGGQAGESKTLEFNAPPPSETDSSTRRPGGEDGPDDIAQPVDRDAKPLTPVYTYVAIGITAALLAGSIVSTIDTNAGVDPYKEAADKWAMGDGCQTDEDDMMSPMCQELYDDAKEKLDEGESKQTRTTVLWVATGVAAAATTAIALLLTDWEGDDTGAAAAARPRLGLSLAPNLRDTSLVLKGNF